MNWAAWTYLCLGLTGVAVQVWRSGEPRPNYDGGTALTGAAIGLLLLYAAGFFG